MLIRKATILDRNDIRGVHLSAFAEDEREIVSKLAVSLLLAETTPETISLIAETQGAVVGHVAFSPVTAVNNEGFQGYILAPLGVKPEHQKRGVGTKLIETGTRQLAGMGVNVLFVYGDPEYYSRFGFTPDAAERYSPPYKLRYPFGWLGVVLDESSAQGLATELVCVTSLRDPELW
jgi:putative acetyltransferase